MDKYTVDLDQVLNDFEYSELTIEQEQHQQLQSQATSLPSRTYSIAKHSINNVFSSLNEYLSSEINDNVPDNNYMDNNCSYKQKLGVSTIATSASLMPTETVASKAHVANLPTSETKGFSGTSDTTDNLPGDKKNVEKNGERKNYEEGFINMTPVKQVPLEVLIENPILLKIEDFIQVEVEQQAEVKENENITCEISEKLMQPEIATVEETNQPSEIHNDSEIKETTHETANTEEPDEPNEKQNVVENLTEIKCDIKVEENKKIGFHIDVDDAEAQKYLDDLDISDDEEFHEVQEMPAQSDKFDESKVEHQETPEICDKPTLSSQKVDEPSNCEVNTSNNNEKSIEVASKIDDVSQNVEIIEQTKKIAELNLPAEKNNSELMDNVEEERPIGQKSNDKVTQCIEKVMCKESEENVENDEPAQVWVEIMPAEKTKSNQEDEEAGKGNVSKIKLGEMSKEAQRPNSLDIKEEPINLIGNPGSTPYNNNYASKQVPDTGNTEVTSTDPPPPYEAESSASVSPTFSEASTESVHSTDSPVLQAKEVDAAQAQPSETDRANESEEGNDEAEGEAEKQTVADASTQEPPAQKSEDYNDDVLVCVALARQLADEEEVYVDLDCITQTETPGPSTEQPQEGIWLGKRPPKWIPDADAICCQHCGMKFTVLKRRHHCRSCGFVLCSKCCNMRFFMEYIPGEARVCMRCYEVLTRDTDSSSDSQNSTPNRQPVAVDRPNPNNPMEYCSIVPPYEQVAGGDSSPPSVMVPVGVLKRKGSNKKHNKSVMFCDGIRPGSDLTNLDNDFNYNENRTPTTAPASAANSQQLNANANAKKHAKVNKNLPLVDPVTQSYIPENENYLPPTVTMYKSDITYTECGNNGSVVEMLQNETLTFSVQRNLHIHVRLVNLDCCINKKAWCFSTEGLIAVGQDEIVILLEFIEGETQVPKDIFHHLNNIYNSAVKGTTVTEMGLSIHPTTNFLDSRSHAGFIFVRPTFQCLQNIIIPKEPYLVGILVHRWETPWARIFPLRLVLRLGAEYRYYPSPLISTRNRNSVFVEIGHTIINILADFRNFSFTLPNIRGLTIHMEEKCTTVSIPVNRYDQVMKSISNSSEHILAFGGNFSSTADSHLVCIQDTEGNNENSYKTHSINIQNKPRKVMGASFIVFNGALKSSSGLTAKSSIVEDGLMIQIPPEHMIQVRENLRNMKNHTIHCGCVNAASDETVNIVWSESDVNFNIGVKSSVDGQSLSGIPSIRVHNGKDFMCNSGNRLIRWTEVFLLQNGEENARTQDPVDISKVAENISKATCQALVKYLDLLATNNFVKIGIRTTLHVDDVSYSAGSNGMKLPPIYMRSLDNELVPVLHRIITSGNVGDGTIVLELIFRILNV